MLQLLALAAMALIGLTFVILFWGMIMAIRERSPIPVVACLLGLIVTGVAARNFYEVLTLP